MREGERCTHAAEHREDADAEAEQRRDPGREDDDQQDQCQRQRDTTSDRRRSLARYVSKS